MAVKTSWSAGDVLAAADLTDTFAAKLTTPSAWTSFTPSWSNLTVGNGTNLGVYCEVGKIVFVRFAFVLGSTSSVGTTPSMTLPVTANTQYATYAYQFAPGHISLHDAGTNQYIGLPVISSASAMSLYANNASGTYTTFGASNVTATVPFTWTNTDGIYGQFYYEAA